MKLTAFDATGLAFGTERRFRYGYGENPMFTIEGLTISEAQAVLAILAKCKSVKDTDTTVFDPAGPAKAETKTAEPAPAPTPEPTKVKEKKTKAETAPAPATTTPAAAAAPTPVVAPAPPAPTERQPGQDDGDDLLGGEATGVEAALPDPTEVPQAIKDAKKISDVLVYIIKSEGVKTVEGVVARVLQYRVIHAPLQRATDLADRVRDVAKTLVAAA